MHNHQATPVVYRFRPTRAALTAGLAGLIAVAFGLIAPLSAQAGGPGGGDSGTQGACYAGDRNNDKAGYNASTQAGDPGSCEDKADKGKPSHSTTYSDNAEDKDKPKSHPTTETKASDEATDDKNGAKDDKDKATYDDHDKATYDEHDKATSDKEDHDKAKDEKSEDDKTKDEKATHDEEDRDKAKDDKTTHEEDHDKAKDDKKDEDEARHEDDRDKAKDDKDDKEDEEETRTQTATETVTETATVTESPDTGAFTPPASEPAAAPGPPQEAASLPSQPPAGQAEVGALAGNVVPQAATDGAGLVGEDDGWSSAQSALVAVGAFLLMAAGLLSLRRRTNS